MASVQRSGKLLLNTAQRVVVASMSASVLVAVVLCALLSQGTVFDYSDNSLVFPRLVPEFNLRRVFSLPHLKEAVLFALFLGVFQVGVANVANNALKALMLQ